MTTVSEILRAHTIPGLKNLEMIPQMSFRGWISNAKYKITKPLESRSFTLDVYEHEDFLLPIAFDINRMATSSFESICGIKPEGDLPKSVGWLIIRTYYSAYFAAQAILRIFGISCSQFDSRESNQITEIAKLYSMQNGNNLSTGYYSCVYETSNSTAQCKLLKNTHSSVWKLFFELLENLAQKVADSDYLKEDRDRVINLLYSIREGLSCRGTKKEGNWLSLVRNDVNYSHSMGAWFPYSNALGQHSEMFRALKHWNRPPSVRITQELNDQILFINTAVSVVALCKELIEDLHFVNSRIFLKYGAIRFINQYQQCSN